MKNNQYKYKKAQLQMTETIFVLVIFFIMLGFGMIYYAKFSINNQQREKSESSDLLAIQYAQKIQFLPEIQCTFQGSIDYNCVDYEKIMALQAIFNSQDDTSKQMMNIYETMFPRTLIKIQELSTETGVDDGDPITIYGADFKESTSNDHKFFVPVSIYHPIEKKNTIGVIEITVYN